MRRVVNTGERGHFGTYKKVIAFICRCGTTVITESRSQKTCKECAIADKNLRSKLYQREKRKQTKLNKRKEL